MAQFRGTLQGNRGEASRLGTKLSGLGVSANTWEVEIQVTLTWNEQEQTNYVRVEATPYGKRHPVWVMFVGTEARLVETIQKMDGL